MTTKTAIKLWSNIDDSSAESLSGGGHSRSRYVAPKVVYKTVVRSSAPAAPAAAPAAPAAAAPLQLFSTVFSPNPVPGGPPVQTRTPIPNEIGVTRFGSLVTGGTIITTG
jgi:hypothetical protein